MLVFFAMAAMWIPNEVSMALNLTLLVDELWFDQLIAWSTFLAMVLVAPVYATSGFALYISRRIELEAWDIEIKFRDMAARYEKKERQKQQRSWVSVWIGFLFISAVFLEFSPQATAESLVPSSSSGILTDGFVSHSTVHASLDDSSITQSKHRVQELLKGEQFNQKEKVLDWRFVEGEAPSWWQSFIKWLLESLKSDEETPPEQNSAFLLQLIKVFEWLVWVFIACLSLYLVMRYRRALLFFLNRLTTFRKNQETIAVEHSPIKDTLLEQDLPKNLTQTVLALYQQNRPREAFSVFYQAALMYLRQHREVPIQVSDTEFDVFKRMQPFLKGEEREWLDALLSSWVQVAYADQLPSIDVLSDLCAQWEKVVDND